MKHTSILFLLFCTSVTVHLQAQLKSISYPIYSEKSSESIEITRIECNDTATIIFTEVYNTRNNWISIASTTTLHGVTTGKDYKLLSAKGFELDKKVYMPASGNVSFQLFFQPLDKKEQIINFVEGPHERDFVINNIELNENYKKKAICCHLSGTIADRPEVSRLILCKFGQAHTQTGLSIPIRNGKFDYNLYTDTEDKFQLILWDEYLNGCMRPTPFFAENGTIQATLHSFSLENQGYNYDIKTDCPLTKEMLAYEEKQQTKFPMNDLIIAQDALEKADNYYSETYKSFQKKFNEAKTPEEREKLYKEKNILEESGVFYTEAAKVNRKKTELRYDSLLAWRMKFIAQHPSLNSLYLLRETMNYNSHYKKDLTPCVKLYNTVFKKKFTKHPVGKEFQQLVDALNIKVGSSYVNFTAPDINGNQIQLSDVIKNKVAIIDLWASWCAPCRRHSIKLIPIYNKYKDKGFTVVSVAREKSNTKAMEEAIQKDGYPWLNLIEINDKAGIWNMYGIPHSAGGIFLVDKSGRILAVDPSAEEVETILEKTL